MASVKELKDEINYLTYDLVNECFTYKVFHPDKQAESDKAVIEIIKLRNQLIGRVNKPGDKKDKASLRAHFREIRADMGKLTKLVENLEK